MINLNRTRNPIDRKGREDLNINWDKIEHAFSNLQRQIKVLAGDEEVDEILVRIETAIANAQDVTTNAQTALDNVTNALLQLNTVISNANIAANRAEVAADEANTLNVVLTRLKVELEALQNDLNGIVEAEIQRVTNEGNRVQAEDVRVDAESLRNDAELVRKQSEVIRNESEDLRNQNETARKNVETERDDAERLRIDEEVERIENENLRISAEDNRIDVEHERVDAEIIRKKNEVDRVGNENVRGNKENERLQAETERIDNEVTREQHEQLRQAAYVLLNELLQNMESLEYDYEETYNFPNFVSYNGSTFIALKEVQGITPIGDGVNYRLVAQRGVDGTGAVSSVNGLSPDPNGNVNLIINYINNLNSERIDAGLSASMGKLLMSLITALQNDKADLSFIVDEIAREIAALVNEAPETLNTINALAQALGEDPNFAVTIMAMLGEKATIADLTTLKNAVNAHLAALNTDAHSIDNIVGLRTELSKKVMSEEGANGIRYFNNELSVEKDDGEWETIEVGGAKTVAFYEYGNENVNITGGWREAHQYTAPNGVGIQVKNPTSLHFSVKTTPSDGCVRTYETTNKVDLTKIKTIFVECELNQIAIYKGCALQISDSQNSGETIFVAQINKLSSGRGLIGLDVSTIIGDYYIKIIGADGLKTSTTIIDVYNVWGEY